MGLNPHGKTFRQRKKTPSARWQKESLIKSIHKKIPVSNQDSSYTNVSQNPLPHRSQVKR